MERYINGSLPQLKPNMKKTLACLANHFCTELSTVPACLTSLPIWYGAWPNSAPSCFKVLLEHFPIEKGYKKYLWTKYI